MPQYILRVDDCGWVPPDKADDRGLVYFQKWRDAFGIAGHPVTLGFIPETMEASDVDWLKANLDLRHGEAVAVHGHNHAAHAEVTASQMAAGLLKFKGTNCVSYIPPFNAYNAQTLIDWSRVCEDGYFFGGFHNEHHRLGNLPQRIHSVWHIPAIRALYDRAGPLLAHLPDWEDLSCPLVLTLHATWDNDNLSALRPLLDAIEPHLAGPECVEDWATRAALELKTLTAPHYIAYHWICNRISVADQVLDFGSRYSTLPVKMALRGCRVTATDRDPDVLNYQSKLQANYRAELQKVLVWDGRQPPDRKDYHIVSSCWAIQHNLGEGEIAQIAANLGAALRPNGRMLLVGSFNAAGTIVDTARKDPQVLLDKLGWMQQVVGPSGCTLEEVDFFRYMHGTPRGEMCDPQDANAICLELRKPG